MTQPPPENTSQSPQTPRRIRYPHEDSVFVTIAGFLFLAVPVLFVVAAVRLSWGWAKVGLGCLALAFIVAIFDAILSKRTHRRQQQQRFATIEQRAESKPENVRFAWDLARVNLERYFDRNLSQIDYIFYIALFVMLAGFAFVGWGIVEAWVHPSNKLLPLVGTGAGIITEFIGGTFMVIYRSTISQASQYMGVLERINNVGMAVQVLDTIPETDPLKNATRAEIVKYLLAPAGTPARTA